ncbi:UNVERIFIED_CONTAM: Ribosome maturation factor RimP [Sesamum latifolium]|uniref:Ribosome maturation factor RimP n=1 Tax=Sesamum latifolium TaxID=2727402 RepID=A0AAW2UTJ0_9LAMI
MRTSVAGRIYCHCSFKYRGLRKISFSSTPFSYIHDPPLPTSQKQGLLYDILVSFKTRRCISLEPTCYFASFAAVRRFHATSSFREDTVKTRLMLGYYTMPFQSLIRSNYSSLDDSNGEVEPIDSWEEEDEAEPQVGDGGDGGGVVLQNCPWGERALSIAQDVLLEFGEEMKLFAFKTSPRGYIYVRLDKLSNEYGCPSMEEIESFSRQYKKKLDEIGARGEIPDDLALEVSSPGADRLLRVPDDLLRFRDMPMVVSYLQGSDSRCPERNGVYFLDTIETESRCCVWKLADVRENRDPSAKGRPLSRKQKDCRLKLPYDMIKRVTLHISY